MRRVLFLLLMIGSCSLACASKHQKQPPLVKPSYTPMDSSEDIVRKAVARDDNKTARGWLSSAAAKNGMRATGF